MREDIFEHVTWRNITIAVSYIAEWLGPSSGYDIAHLEIKTVDPEWAPLPITETGYRSHFCHPDRIDEAGGPVAYLLAHLEKEAAKSGWAKREAASRQMSLF